MVNKKGWLRIVEAFLAVMLILGGITFLLLREKNEIDSENVYLRDLIKSVLEEIAKNEELRNLALEKNESELKEKIKNLIFESFEFEIRVCNLTEKVCLMGGDYPNKDIHVEERMISGNLEIYDPVKVRIFLWRKD